MTQDQIPVSVTAIKQVAATIREYTLTPIGTELFAFSPGSHVVVSIPAGEKTHKNAYSLLSDPRDTSSYRIAVRLQENSRGGSKAMHENVVVGSRLTVSPPANLFAPDWTARKYVLIAGGVGITPFMSYLPELKRRRAPFELHYLYRGDTTGAYVSELAHLLGDQFYAYDSKQSRCELAAVLANRSVGTHFYICGPEALISDLQKLADELGLPASVIHIEAFAAPPAGRRFQVEVESTGKLVTVAEEQSMLEALEAAEVAIPNLCRGGVCGQCLCQVTSGEPEHHDSYLSPQEKSDGELIMPCVSRAKSDRLVIAI